MFELIVCYTRWCFGDSWEILSYPCVRVSRVLDKVVCPGGSWEIASYPCVTTDNVITA